MRGYKEIKSAVLVGNRGDDGENNLKNKTFYKLVN